MAISFTEPLRELSARLKGDASLTALVPASRIANHLPQNSPLPYVRFRYDPGDEWDQKDSDGLDGSFIIDIWSETHSDKPILDVMSEVHRLLQNYIFNTTEQSLLMRFVNSTTFYEPDGVTHHGVMNFRYIQTT